MGNKTETQLLQENIISIKDRITNLENVTKKYIDEQLDDNINKLLKDFFSENIWSSF